MKLIKAINQGITTSLDGVLYTIGETPIEVTDEVAVKLNILFGRLIEITESLQPVSVTETPVVKTDVPIVSEETPKSKKKKKNASDSII